MKERYVQAMIAERFQMLKLCWDGREETMGEVGGKDAHEDLAQGELEEPPRVLLVERLMSDMEALQELATPATTPRVRLCALGDLVALYVPGDASGLGLGLRSQGLKESCTSQEHGEETGRTSLQTSKTKPTVHIKAVPSDKAEV